MNIMNFNWSKKSIYVFPRLRVNKAFELEFCSCRFRALQCWLKGFKTLTCMLLVPMIVACACCICHARLLQLRCASYNQPSIATSGVPCTVQSDGRV